MTDIKHVEPRPVVQWFAQEMERKLRVNDHKGGRQGEDTFHLAYRLHDEWHEMVGELAYFQRNPDATNAATVAAKCADIANFAMMIADIMRQEVLHD